MQVTDTVKTTCAYCGVGCGLKLKVNDGQSPLSSGDKPLLLTGDPTHPANYGRLCSKGTALAETLGPENRLAHPKVHGQHYSWDAALDYIAAQLGAVLQEYGPESVAFYLSGQLLTEDYYVANKLMKGFLGSANVDTNSRLCMSSSVVGHKRAFGTDTVPGCYEDLELADLVILTGSNTAWCHPVLFQRIKAAKKQRPSMKIVVIDPRRTPTCDIADLHLPLQSGTDAFLFNGLLAYLARLGELDLRYLEAHVEGFGDTLHHARNTASDLTALARICGLQEAAVAQFFDLFRRHEKVVTAYSQGINQSSSGSNKVNAIINCHLATGRIGKPGMGPFSLTGQPNAMGGREVGGLANQLAAHMDFAPADIDRVQRFWAAPAIATQPGLKAVDLFDAVHSGKIRAVWIMGTNPAVSMPEADKVAEALRRCPLVIVSDCIEHTDTTAFAHVLLPAQGWGEKDGTVTNSERCISRQRQIVESFAEARPDWWIVTQVARRLGFAKAFPYQTAHEIFIEHAKLSAFENDAQGKRRDFNLSGLTQLDKQGYDALHPVQWPVLPEYPEGTRRLFEDGQFFTPSGKARMLPIEPTLPKGETNSAYPLVLNTGRIRDQWHSMTRTALSPRLNQHIDEPICQIHPADAMANQLRNDTLVRIDTATGHCLARLLITEEQRPGSLFLPMHWTRQNSAQGRIGPLVNAFTDPFSGQPESKHTPARVSAWKPLWQAFVFTRHPVKPDAAYWVQVPCDGFMRFEIADTLPLAAPAEWIKQLLPAGNTEAHEWLEYHDQNSGQHRVALTLNDRLEACIFYSSGKPLPDHSWISKLLKQESLSAADRMCLLSARPPQGSTLEGKMVCACFSVGESTICRTIQEKSLRSVEAVGACLQAGTNCGSCLPELKKLLDQTVAR